MPAMAADKEKTKSFVAVRFNPNVAHAASESFMATRTRPKDPRRNARRPTEKQAKTTARTMANDLSVVADNPNIAGRGIWTDPLKPNTADHGKIMLSIALANAMVAKAKY